MAKDPAFLFYSKDWLEGTMEMTSEEKGVYIDLLAHQHQKGDLPSDTKRLCKLVGLSEDEFLRVWSDISYKFTATKDNRLVNRKLTEVVTERSKIGHTNKIISALAVAVRRSDASQDIKYKAKMGFKVSDFLNVPDQDIIAKVTEWYTERLTKCFAIGNGIGNEDAIIYSDNSSLTTGLVVDMAKIFKTANPNIQIQPNVHYPACLQLAYRIAKLKKWEEKEVLNGKLSETLKSWTKIVQFIKSDEWLCTRSLIDLNSNKEWDRLVLKMSKPAKKTKEDMDDIQTKKMLKEYGL